MKPRNIIYSLAIIVLVSVQLSATNINPIVTNVAFGILSGKVTVTYDVADLEQSTVTISMEVSSDSGATWNYNYGSALGDIGANVAVGNGKTITWTYSGEYNAKFKIKIIADDLVGDQIYFAGKIYNTITIGSQIWLRENLDVGVYAASTNTGSIHSDVTNNGIIEKYCYGNNEANCTTYGGLYDWNEAMQYVTTAGTKGICPTGWHIPTLAEFETLKAAVGNDGNALKAVGEGTGAGAGTNTSGFSALLAGYRTRDGGFSNLGYFTYFWSSTENPTTTAYSMFLWPDRSDLFMNAYDKEFGFSVRCLKD